MPQFKKVFTSFIISLSIAFLSLPSHTVYALSDIPFILLSKYEAELNIGDQVGIIAFTTTGKQATWKSSDSKIASVNTYGVITAKRAGTTVITAKIKGAEASCEVTVNKTIVTISKTTASLEHGETLRLLTETSNSSPVTWKSSKKSIATVDEYGKVTGMKPGETIITATADRSSAICIITVKYPTISLNTASTKLYRGQTAKLSATVSSGVKPTWKTNRKSVAIVDAAGTVTAMKNGTAIITATVDGVSQTCEILVQKPEITLSSTQVSLKMGDKATLTATVSSNNRPNWSSSNTNVVSVNSKGDITALQKGKAYIYATEDGTKVRCVVTVTE